jgi:hypothetical protein
MYAVVLGSMMEKSFRQLRSIEPQTWKAVIGWALVGSLGSYLVFEVWMKLRLPKGFLGV